MKHGKSIDFTGYWQRPAPALGWPAAAVADGVLKKNPPLATGVS